MEEYLLKSMSEISGVVGFVAIVLGGIVGLFCKRKSNNDALSVFTGILAAVLFAFYIGNYDGDPQQKTNVPSSAVAGVSSEDTSTGMDGYLTDAAGASSEANTDEDPTDDFVEVPDVCGMNVYEAEQLLTVAGLNGELESPIDDITESRDYVSSQSPEAGRREKRGTVITLTRSSVQTTSPKQTLDDYFSQKITQGENSTELLDAKDGSKIIYWENGNVDAKKYNFNKTDDQISERLAYLPKELCYVKISFLGLDLSGAQLTIGYRRSDGSKAPTSLQMRPENNSVWFAVPKGTYIFEATTYDRYWTRDIQIEQSDHISVQIG